jgi:hydroxymethylglutaryl-CoA lyase
MPILPKKIHLVEVGPRDGLQNETTIVPTAIKLEFINELLDAGVTTLEATSFVSPKWVPQMADHSQLMQQLKPRTGVRALALVPNLQGLESARAVGVTSIAIFTAASETFTKKNINASIAESLERFRAIAQVAVANHMAMRGYISCVAGCPYEGLVAPEKVLMLAQELLDLGCYQISLGDTIGVGNPDSIARLLDTVLKKVPAESLAVHFHDTYGLALANLMVALNNGITTIDSSAAGLGGCPYAQGASGNVATEDVLYLLQGLGYDTGIDLMAVAKSGRKICDFLGKKPTSKVNLAVLSGHGS